MIRVQILRTRRGAPVLVELARVEDRPGNASHDRSTTENTIMASNIIMNIGEALVGEGNEIAHIDLLIGDKSGPVGVAFANALANQSAGHSNLLAVLTPNLIAKPATVLITKVTIKGMEQALQMFGPAQYAVAKAVADSVADNTIPAAQADDLVIVCGVFIHPAAKDKAKILKFNYEATKLSIQRAMKSLPTPAEITAQKDSVKHPFAE
jgi:5,6,7,8-tetrahydromethanopterin hydro-lyase